MNTYTSRHIVDGANGFVGANLLHTLLATGREAVALARTPDEVVRQRVAIAEVAREPLDTSGLRVVGWSLDEPDLGLDRATLRSLFAEPCDYWHLAAAISFRPGNREELTRVNVGGTVRALDTFQRYAAPGSRFFLVSSAYSCGLSSGLVEEGWHPPAEPSAFRNFYEYTKRAAEQAFAERWKSAGLNGAVLRLGQVVGDSVSGRAATDYGLYDYVRAISTITRRRPGERLRIVGDPAAALHLVPIDACVRWLIGLADRTPEALRSPIVHVVDRTPVPAQRVADAIGAHLPTTLTVAPAAEVADQLNHLERVLEARVTYTGRYLTQRIAFDRTHLVELGLDEPTTVDDDVLDRLVGQFVADLESPSESVRPYVRPATPALAPPRTAPSTGTAPVELLDRVTAIWSEVLGPPCAPDARFFELGGHSLAAFRILGKLQAEYGVSLDVTVLFDDPRLDEFAAHVAAMRAGSPVPQAESTPDVVREPSSGTPQTNPIDPARSDHTITIGERIGQLAKAHPDRLAVVSVGLDGARRTLTWDQLERRSNAVARTLRARGVAPDGVVAIALPAGLDHVVASLAAWKLGTMVVPVDPDAPPAERDGIARVLGEHMRIDTGTDLAGTGQADDPLPPLGTPRSASLTGGTTGLPRVVVRQRSWSYRPDGVLSSGDASRGMRFGQVQLVVLPMHHAGFTALHQGLALDHLVVVTERFVPQMFPRLVREYAVSYLRIVPALMRMILDVPGLDPADLTSLEAIHHGAGPCPERVKRRWLELVEPDRVIEDYASQERLGSVMIRGDEWLRHPGSVGRPTDCEVRILDEDGGQLPVGVVGTVFLRSAATRQPEYVGAGPNLPEHDGFMSLGDLGFLDAEGYLYLVGRETDVLNVGGVNVFPAEVEAVLHRHTGVADAVVTGRPHEYLGRSVHALVVPADHEHPVSFEELEAYCRHRLSPTKVPMSYELVSEIPRASNGKLRRRDLPEAT